jgi:hypothetical protein
MQEIWKLEEMSGEIIGITPHLNITGYGWTPRGCEIECYLRGEGFYHLNWDADKQLEIMKASNIANYIIIDDDGDMLYGQRDHFVQTLPAPRNLSGFNKHYYEEALVILSNTVIGLQYS